MARDFMELGDRLGHEGRVRAVLRRARPSAAPSAAASRCARRCSCWRRTRAPAAWWRRRIAISGMLLEMGGVAAKNDGARMANEIVKSGKALKKFKEIIEAQGGDPNVTSDTVPVGDKVATVLSPQDGYITDISNKRLVAACRLASAPTTRARASCCTRRRASTSDKGDGLFTLYADKEWKLDAAIKESLREPIIYVEGMILEKIQVV